MFDKHFDITVGTVNLACVWDGDEIMCYHLAVEDGEPVALDEHDIACLKKALAAMDLVRGDRL